MLERLQAVCQVGEVSTASGDEGWQFRQLGHADSRLHVGHLQVVTEVRINVLVVIALGQGAEAPPESFATGVRPARAAIAVPTPIAERLGDGGKLLVTGVERPPLTSSHLVGRIETRRGQIAKTA